MILRYIALVILFVFNSQAQIVAGGGHEILIEKLPDDEQIRLPENLYPKYYISLEHTGLSNDNSTSISSYQMNRLIQIQKTFNFLKEVDLNCSIKNNQNSLFKGANSIHEIYYVWATFISIEKISRPIEIILNEPCLCSSPANNLRCIKENETLKNMLYENILNSKSLDEDLRMLGSKDSDANIDFSLKKLLLDFYE